jgi:predicted RNA binding protein YcfA (HicA-like mRNA interferase family)
MPGKLPVLSGKEVIKALSRVGFQAVRQRGSHVVLVKYIESQKIAVVVPNHKEIDKGTLLEIMREARLTREEFEKLI